MALEERPENAEYEKKGVKKCIEELASPSPLTRAKALYGLGKIGKETLPHLPKIVEFLEEDPEAMVRLAAAKAMTTFVQDTERQAYRAGLQRLLKKETEEEVLEAVREVLHNYDVAEAEDRAKALLSEWSDLTGLDEGAALLEHVRLGNIKALVHAPPLLLYNRAFALEAVKRNVRALEYLDRGLWADRIVILAALEVSHPLLSGGAFVWQLTSEELQEDQDFVRQALLLNGYALEFVRPRFQMDKQLVLVAVRQAGGALRHASAALRADEAVVREAVRQDGLALEFAHEQLQANPEVAYEAVSQNISALKFTPSVLRGERAFVLRCLRHSAFALQFASDELRGDREFLVQAMKQDGLCGRDGLILQYASEELRSDADLLLIAMRRTTGALRIVPAELLQDRTFVFKAVMQTPCALKFASNALREDRAFVIEAVRRRGACLQYSLEGFRSDREVVIAAVTSDRGALAYASEELREDRALLGEVNKRIRAAKMAEDDEHDELE